MILSSDKDRALALDALQKINSGKKEDILYGFEVVNSLLHTIVNSPAMFRDVSEAARDQNTISRAEFYAYTEVGIDQYSTFLSLGTARKCDLTDLIKEFFIATGLPEINLRIRDSRPTNQDNLDEEEDEDDDDDDEDTEYDEDEEEEEEDDES
jgi:hypothetical protein